VALAHFKGTVFQSTKLFVEKEFGVERAGQVLAALSAEDRGALSEVTPIAWVPVEPVMRYHHEMDRLCGKGDLAVCTRAGRFSAGWSLNTVLKVFLKFKSPNWLIERSTSVWNRYHDTGRWTTDLERPGKFASTLHEFAVRDPAMCARLRGWLVGAIELTGGRNASVQEVQCACRSGDKCVFAIEWAA
jgi:hypothetical protein